MMACFVEINSNPVIIVNADNVETIQRFDDSGNISYSATTFTSRYPMDEEGYKRFFKNPFIAAVVESR